MSKTCIRCKTDNKDDAEFCIKCGSTFKDVKSGDVVNNQFDDKIGVEEENKNQSGKSNKFENINSDKIIKSKKKSKKRKISILIILGVVILLVICAFAGVFDVKETVSLSDGATFQVPSGYEYDKYNSIDNGATIYPKDDSSVLESIDVGLQTGDTHIVDKVWEENTYTVNGYEVTEYKSELSIWSSYSYSYDYYIEKDGYKYYIYYYTYKNPDEVNFEDYNNPARQVIESFQNP